MSKEHAPLSRKEEEEKKAAEAQQQSGYNPGKGNATYNRMMNKLSPLKGGSMFKKKANVSQPGDASELQADAVAKAVTEGNANAAQVELQNDVSSGESDSNRITAKASDVTIETPPGFEEQIEKMKGGGLPLPDDKKANLEEMLGTDLDHVRLHTGSDAAELSAQINALAFATGDDIFYPGDLNDEELLAHEVTHTLQGNENQISAKHGDVTYTQSKDSNVPDGWNVEVYVSKDTLPGDTDHQLLYDLITALYPGVTERDAWRGAAAWGWQGLPAAYKAGTTTHIPMNNGRFIYGLELTYVNYNANMIYEFTSHLKSSGTAAYTVDVQHKLHQAVRLLALITDKEYPFYENWQAKQWSLFSTTITGKIRDITLENLGLYVSGWSTFLANKLSNVADNKELESFGKTAYKEDNELNSEFNALRDKIDGLDQQLVKRYTDLTRKGNFKQILKGVFIPWLHTYDEIIRNADIAALDSDLKKEGSSFAEMTRFVLLFQEMAIGKAFYMLEENRNIIYKEKDRYADKTELKKLHRYLIDNYTDDFWRADELRAEGVIRFFEKEYDHANGVIQTAIEQYVRSSGDLTKDLFRHRHNKAKLTKRINELESPHDVIESLSGIMRIREYLKDPSNIVDDLFPKNLIIIGQPLNPYADRVLKEYPEFKKAFNMDMATHEKIHQEGGKLFPVLYDYSTNFKKLAAKPLAQFKKELYATLNDKLSKNNELRGKLAADPELIWKLEGVLEVLKMEKGVTTGMPSADVIDDVSADVENDDLWRSLGLGALGIVLGILGFFTAGSTWAALALWGASLTINLIDLYLEYQKYHFQTLAIDTALGTANELSAKEPNALGIVFAVVGMLIDFADIVRIIKLARNTKVIGKASKKLATETAELVETGTGHIPADEFVEGLQDQFATIYRLEDETLLREEIGKLWDLLGKKRIKGSPSRKKFIDDVFETVQADKQVEKKVISLLHSNGVSPDSLSPTALIGLQRIYRVDEYTAQIMTNVLKRGNQVGEHLLLETLLSPGFEHTLVKISKLKNFWAPDVERVFAFIGNASRKEIYKTLDETVENLKHFMPTNSELIVKILQSGSLHKYVNSLPDVNHVNKLWGEWAMHGRSKTFEEFVHDASIIEKKNGIIQFIEPDVLKKINSLLNNIPEAIKGIHFRLKNAGTKFKYEDGKIKYFNNKEVEIGRIENKDFVVTPEKKTIPLPSTYLDVNYITKHIERFMNEGGAFVIRKRDVISRPEFKSMPERKFVGLKSEMDNVITSYSKSGNDQKVLINELDLGDNYFRNGDEVFYVTVAPEKGFKFDIPSGNEGGAYEGFWVPGGFTKHGTAEAVILGSENLVHNNNWETFVGFFGKENVLKIK